MTILITGASGAIGLPTLRHLVKRGARVRALSSRESSAANLKSLGVAETVIGDLTSDADVARAMQGVASVMHIPPRFREDEAKIGLRVLKAAVDAKVGHFVFSSVFHPQMRDMDHHFNKLVVEEALIDSGLAFTILQPAMFMQNIRLEWPGIRDRGVYLRPYSPDQRMAMIDTEDYGEAAARVLTEPGYRGGIFELAGPDQLTTAEMAEGHRRGMGQAGACREAIDRRVEVMGQGEQLESLGRRSLRQDVPPLRRTRLCRRQSARAVGDPRPSARRLPRLHQAVSGAAKGLDIPAVIPGHAR